MQVHFLLGWFGWFIYSAFCLGYAGPDRGSSPGDSREDWTTQSYDGGEG